MCIYVQQQGLCACMCRCPPAEVKGGCDPLNTEVLANKLGSSAKAVRVLTTELPLHRLVSSF